MCRVCRDEFPLKSLVFALASDSEGLIGLCQHLGLYLIVLMSQQKMLR